MVSDWTIICISCERNGIYILCNTRFSVNISTDTLSVAEYTVSNLITALTAIVGGLIGYCLAPYIGDAIVFLLPFAAGGFIYIAASDLIPELHKEIDIKRSVIAFLFFVIGILLMWYIRIVFKS